MGSRVSRRRKKAASDALAEEINLIQQKGADKYYNATDLETEEQLRTEVKRLRSIVKMTSPAKKNRGSQASGSQEEPNPRRNAPVAPRQSIETEFQHLNVCPCEWYSIRGG